MSDMENVFMIIDMFVELLDIDDFIQSDWDSASLVIEGFA